MEWFVRICWHDRHRAHVNKAALRGNLSIICDKADLVQEIKGQEGQQGWSSYPTLHNVIMGFAIILLGCYQLISLEDGGLSEDWGIYQYIYQTYLSFIKHL